jgi:AhpD family alkylhydroperoxidase
MVARLNFHDNAVAASFGKHVNLAGKAVTDSSLPAVTQALVKIRASQINGCAACTDAHTKDAEHAGESPVRLNLVAVWREATVFTDAERAALELTEQGTRIADAAGGVTDEAWANAAKHHDDDQLAALVSLIALINTYNRVNVILRRPGVTTSPASGDSHVRHAVTAGRHERHRCSDDRSAGAQERGHDRRAAVRRPGLAAIWL